MKTFIVDGGMLLDSGDNGLTVNEEMAKKVGDYFGKIEKFQNDTMVNVLIPVRDIDAKYVEEIKSIFISCGVEYLLNYMFIDEVEVSGFNMDFYKDIDEIRANMPEAYLRENWDIITQYLLFGDKKIEYKYIPPQNIVYLW